MKKIDIDGSKYDVADVVSSLIRQLKQKVAQAKAFLEAMGGDCQDCPELGHFPDCGKDHCRTYQAYEISETL